MECDCGTLGAALARLIEAREAVTKLLHAVQYIGCEGDIILEICGHFVRLKHESQTEIGVEAINAMHRLTEIQEQVRTILQEQ